MIRPEDLEILHPEAVAQAVEMKARWGVRAAFMAGGSELIPRLERDRPDDSLTGLAKLISLEDIPELALAETDDQGWTAIGPLACLSLMADDPWLNQYHPMLAQAGGAAAARPNGRLATLGGNLCSDTRCGFLDRSAQWWASRPDCFKLGGRACYVDQAAPACQALAATEIPPALIALHAEVELTGPQGSRRLPTAELFSGNGAAPLILEADELLTAVLVPPPVPNWRETFVQAEPDRAGDEALASLALRIRFIEGQLMNARLVLGSVASGPVRAQEAEKLLIEARPSRETFARAAELVVEQLDLSGPVSAVNAAPARRRAVVRDLVVASLTRLTEAA